MFVKAKQYSIKNCLYLRVRSINQFYFSNVYCLLNTCVNNIMMSIIYIFIRKIDKLYIYVPYVCYVGILYAHIFIDFTCF